MKACCSTAAAAWPRKLLLCLMLPLIRPPLLLLLPCRTYEVTGAAKALRGMWPLVFSKGDDVKGAVLDSWHILHLHNRTPKEQVGIYDCNEPA
jgi:hypothetical protein